MDGSRARAALGLPADASQHDVKTAFRQLAKQAHPDRGGDREYFEHLWRAYEAALGDTPVALERHGPDTRCCALGGMPPTRAWPTTGPASTHPFLVHTSVTSPPPATAPFRHYRAGRQRRRTFADELAAAMRA